jgi:hypothetical protein
VLALLRRVRVNTQPVWTSVRFRVRENSPFSVGPQCATVSPSKKSPVQNTFRDHDRERLQALLKPVSQVRILPGHYLISRNASLHDDRTTRALDRWSKRNHRAPPASE